MGKRVEEHTKFVNGMRDARLAENRALKISDPNIVVRHSGCQRADGLDELCACCVRAL
jgi:hypothetical protein